MIIRKESPGKHDQGPPPSERTRSAAHATIENCEREGVLREMKRTAYYEKPSDRNRRNLRKSKRRFQKFGEPENTGR